MKVNLCSIPHVTLNVNTYILHSQRGSLRYFKFSALKLTEKHSCENLRLDNSAGNDG
jgi:hypothetical protein